MIGNIATFIFGFIVTYIWVAKNKLIHALIAAVVVLVLYNLVVRIKLTAVIAGCIGGVLGFIFYRFFEITVDMFEFEKFKNFYYEFENIIKLTFVYIGVITGIKKIPEFIELDRDILSRKRVKMNTYILDTSILIDGRIADLIETGIIDGNFIIPVFILNELHIIADSHDDTKRARGRRGMDVVEKLKMKSNINLKVVNIDYKNMSVDEKLIKASMEHGFKLLTNDYNLYRNARIQGVSVVNLNEVANVLKIPALPGEVLTVQIEKEGKEKDQGVGFLSDGTMVVVENGRKLLGGKVQVQVVSSIQTSSGRMIFARPLE